MAAVSYKADPTKPTEDTDPTVLDIGSGKLVAETIALNSNIFKADASGLQENFTVKDGDLEVGSSLTSVNSNVVLGDGTSTVLPYQRPRRTPTLCLLRPAQCSQT